MVHPVDLMRPSKKGRIGRLAHSILSPVNSILGSMMWKFVLSNLFFRVSYFIILPQVH